MSRFNSYFLYQTGVKFTLAALVVLGISACASAPDLPIAEINRAEKTLLQAEESNAPEYAPNELRGAREKLSSARKLLQKATQEKDADAAKRAYWLAEESITDSELAIAKGDEARAKKVNKEMQDTVDVLKEELNGNL